MPSGYTSELVEKNLNFRQFALLCARAFGVCISMRDDPLDKPIPEKIEPISTYHRDELARAKQKLKKLLSLKTKSAREKWAVDKINEDLASSEKFKKEEGNDNTISKYEEMLDKVKNWTPPTSEHAELKKFMTQQLMESIKWDAHTDYWSEAITRLEQKLENPLEFYKEEVKKAKESVKYHQEHWKKDVEGARKATKWLQQLRKSLEKHEKLDRRTSD